MPFAITVLLVLALACALSSLVTQGQEPGWYREQYGERGAALILALHADDAYHSWWFLLLSAFLCLSLILCNLSRLPSLIRRVKQAGDPARIIRTEAEVTREGIADPEPVFTAMRMTRVRRAQTEEGQEIIASVRNKAGLWGAWVCHLGVLLLIAGFALGQMTTEQVTVYGMAGDTLPVGETGLELTVDDFRVEIPKEGAAEHYVSEVTVRDPAGGRQESAEVSLNAPATLLGYRFFQNATGWEAARVRVFKNGEPLQEETLRIGGVLPVADKPELVVYLRAFRPDEGYLYMVYYQGELLGMNLLREEEELTIDEYTVRFDQPCRATLLVAKKDRFTGLVLLGGLITLTGLVLAFYLRPGALWAVRNGDGAWTVCGKSRGDPLFRDRLEEALKQAGGAEKKEENGKEEEEECL